MIIHWYITPLNTPTIIKNCSRCGDKSEFVCSNSFRINAQQKRLDVWLIYKCEQCNDTWNMDILTRRKPEEIKPELFNGFLNNDIDLVYKYAFDPETLSRNKAKACYDHVELSVQGDIPNMNLLRNEPVTLIIKTLFDLQVRLDKLLSDKLGISRKVVKECLKANAIWSDDFGFGPEKPAIKLNGSLKLHVDLRMIQNLL